jgi:dipeptidyl aminopeptidase/acylaminoacyl peptidase
VNLDVDGTVYGLLHLPPAASAAQPVPVALLLPGMDMTKEYLPVPEHNIFAERGMAVLALDPPGHGFTWAKGVHITARNVEQTCSAAIDRLASHPEIDIDRVTVVGLGTGGYFGVSAASEDPRITAVAAVEGGFFYDNVAMLADEAPVRRARLRGMSGLSDEDLDVLMTEMAIEGREARVTCPVLLVTGEWDELTPPKEVRRLFDALGGPAEIAIYEDEGHVIGGAMFSALRRAADFLADRNAGKPVAADRVDAFVGRSV